MNIKHFVNYGTINDIHDNHQVVVTAQGLVHEQDNCLAGNDEIKEKPGPRKHFLFIKDDDATHENVLIKNREKERFQKYLSDHKLGNHMLNSHSKDTLNDVIICFLQIWMEYGLTEKNPTGGAVFRFLTDDCGLMTKVIPDSYTNKLKIMLANKSYSIETYRKVNGYFLDLQK